MTAGNFDLVLESGTTRTIALTFPENWRDVYTSLEGFTADYWIRSSAISVSDIYTRTSAGSTITFVNDDEGNVKNVLTFKIIDEDSSLDFTTAVHRLTITKDGETHRVFDGKVRLEK